MLRRIGDPQDTSFSQALLWSVNDSLDWITARNIVILFAQAAYMRLGAADLNALVAGFLAATKNRQTRQGSAIRWPENHAIEAAAEKRVGASAPRSSAELEVALTDSFQALDLEWFEPVLREGE